MKSDFLIALTQLAAERHLPKEEVLKAIEAALASAFKKDNWGEGVDIAVKLNPNTGDIKAYALKTVVQQVEDPRRELSLVEAGGMKPGAALGDVLELESLSHQASRIAAQTAKQVVLQRLREAERDLIFEEFTKREEDIVSGVIGQVDPTRGLVLELDRTEAILPFEEQVPTERYRRGQRLKVYVSEVARSAKGPEIIVSRSHKNLLKCLFELEVPEVYNGIVEIRAISREAGSRSKVAVVALQDGVDPVGSCIGMRGNRIQNIVNELQGEKIDVVRWDRDLKRFISNALNPAEVVHVEANEPEMTAVVVVPERQLSLAIGKEGQNARLAARLTGWHLDIKSMSEWEAMRAQIKLELDEAPADILENELAPDLTDEQPAGEVVQAEPAITEEIPIGADQTEEVEAPVLEEALAEMLAEEVVGTANGEREEGPSIEEELATLVFDTDEDETTDDTTDEEAEEFDFASVGDEIWEPPNLTPDAGKIRFAEDILDDYRGGRRDRKTGSRAPKRGAWRAGKSRKQTSGPSTR